MKQTAKKKGPTPHTTSSSSILVHAERCTGCGACEKACAIKKTGRDDPEGSAMRVAQTPSGNGWVPLACAACLDAVCVSVCPGEALSRDVVFGAVALRPETCSSCSSCILSCPFEILHMGERRQVPRHCDLCGGAPECVKACPTGALEAVDGSDRKALARLKSAADAVAKLLRDGE